MVKGIGPRDSSCCGHAHQSAPVWKSPGLNEQSCQLSHPPGRATCLAARLHWTLTSDCKTELNVSPNKHYSRWYFNVRIYKINLYDEQLSDITISGGCFGWSIWQFISQWFLSDSPVYLSLHCIDYVVEHTPPAQSRRVLNSASIFRSHMQRSSV